MGVEKGSAFLLKVGDGAAPATYATVAGMRTTQLSVNGEAANITSKDSGGWRELLSGAGVRSVIHHAYPSPSPGPDESVPNVSRRVVSAAIFLRL